MAHEGKEVESIDETCESYVTFNLSGHYEWLNTQILNVVSGVFNDECLSSISFPPTNTKKMKYKGERGLFRHFEKENGEWTFINHKNPCLQCASPWCKFKKNKQKVVDIVNKKKSEGNA